MCTGWLLCCARWRVPEPTSSCCTLRSGLVMRQPWPVTGEPWQLCLRACPTKQWAKAGRTRQARVVGESRGSRNLLWMIVGHSAAASLETGPVRGTDQPVTSPWRPVLESEDRSQERRWRTQQTYTLCSAQQLGQRAGAERGSLCKT